MNPLNIHQIQLCILLKLLPYILIETDSTPKREYVTETDPSPKREYVIETDPSPKREYAKVLLHCGETLEVIDDSNH